MCDSRRARRPKQPSCRRWALPRLIAAVACLLGAPVLAAAQGCPGEIAEVERWRLPAVADQAARPDFTSEVVLDGRRGYRYWGACNDLATPYIARCEGELATLDLDWRGDSIVRARVSSDEYALRALVPDGDHVYVIGQRGTSDAAYYELHTWAVRDPAAPRDLGSSGRVPFCVLATPSCRVVLGRDALFIGGGSGIAVFSLADRDAPRHVASLDYAGDVAVAGTTLFVAGEAGGREASGLYALDVRDPSNPITLSYTNTDARRVDVFGDRAIVVHPSYCPNPDPRPFTPPYYQCGEWIDVFDIADPARPTRSWGQVGGSYIYFTRPRSAAIIGDRLFTASVDAFDLAAPTPVVIARYAVTGGDIVGLQPTGDRLALHVADTGRTTEWLVLVRTRAPPTAHPPVAASSQLAGWPIARLIDGATGDAWSSQPHGERLLDAEWLAVTLGQRMAIDEVRLVPRRNHGDPDWSLGFPEDFLLQYADEYDGGTCEPTDPGFDDPGNWRHVTMRQGYGQPPPAAQRFTFAPRAAGCVRVLAVELGQDEQGARLFQLAEIEVLGGGERRDPRSASASSALDGWPVGRVIDGDHATVWSSQAQRGHLTAAEWAVLTPRAPTVIDGIDLAMRVGAENRAVAFPEDLLIQSAGPAAGTCDPTDPRFARADNWSPLASRNGLAQPQLGSAPDARAVAFRFPRREVGCVRVLATELGQDEYGVRRFQAGRAVLRAGGIVIPVSTAAVSSEIEGWPASCLVREGSCSWSSRAHREHTGESEWISVATNRCVVVDEVRLAPRRRGGDPTVSLGLPKDLVLQYAVHGDGTTCDAGDARFARDDNWRPLDVRSELPAPDSDAVHLTFEPRAVGCVRLIATELGTDDQGVGFFQLDEMALYRGGERVDRESPRRGTVFVPFALDLDPR